MKLPSRLTALMMVGFLASAGCAHPQLHSLTRDASEPQPTRDLPNFGKVSPALYRGAQPTTEGFKQLEKMGIRTVVDLRAWHDDQPMLAGTHLKLLHISCYPTAMREEDVLTFLKIVNDPENQPVFVHCEFGADRTGMMVAAYRVAMQAWPNQAAAGELQEYGFHEMFGGIRGYVGSVDGERLKRATLAPEGMAGAAEKKL